MSPGHPRFTKSAITRLRQFLNKNIVVQQADFRQSLTQHADTFAYLDPPYVIKSALYGHKGDTHKDFDHQGLVKLLKQRDNWLLPYNDCATIRDYYAVFLCFRPNGNMA